MGTFYVWRLELYVSTDWRRWWIGFGVDATGDEYSAFVRLGPLAFGIGWLP